MWWSPWIKEGSFSYRLGYTTSTNEIGENPKQNVFLLTESIIKNKNILKVKDIIGVK